MNKTSLVLEGGGMRGIFTAGVLDFFLEKNLSFKQIIGVSAGACHACSFLSKQKGRARDVSIDYLDNKHYCSTYSLITTGDLFGKKFAYHAIPYELNPFDFETFKHKKTQFFCTVTNIQTGKAEYLLNEDLHTDMEALRASASMPFVSKPVAYMGQKYLDGGIADSIPVQKSLASNCNKHVVILTQARDYVKPPTGKKLITKLLYAKYPKLIEAIQNRHNHYNQTLKEIEELEANGSIFVIRPRETPPIKRIEKEKSKLYALYNMGYNTAQEVYDSLLAYLDK